MSEGKAAIIAFSALCLTQSYFSAFTIIPNNWKEGLMGQIPILRTPFRRKETTIKREWREIEGGGDPKHTGGTRKSSSYRTEDQSPLVNSVHLSLIVKNTVLTVVHTLKPSSLAHSLQIHCTGLTGLRSIHLGLGLKNVTLHLSIIPFQFKRK